MARFTASNYYSLSNSGTGFLFLDNPSSAPHSLEVRVLRIAGTQKGRYRTYKDVTEDSAGSTANPAVVDGTGSSIDFTANAGGSYSSKGNSVIDQVLPGGISSNAIGSSVSSEEVHTIEPGENLLVQIDNETSNSGNFSVAMQLKEV